MHQAPPKDQKQVHRAKKSQANNMNEDKSNSSISHVDCTKNISVFSKIRKRRRNRTCFRCMEKGHFIASCPHMKNQDRASPKMTNNKEMSKEQTTRTTEHHIY